MVNPIKTFAGANKILSIVNALSGRKKKKTPLIVIFFILFLATIFLIFIFPIIVVIAIFVLLSRDIDKPEEETTQNCEIRFFGDNTVLKGFDYRVYETGKNETYEGYYTLPTLGKLSQGWNTKSAVVGSKHLAYDIADQKIVDTMIKSFSNGTASVKNNIIPNTLRRWYFCGTGICWYLAHTREDVQFGYGNQVDINHGQILTRYAHLKKVFVQTGDTVGVGEVIGLQGTTGYSTGKHLHFEIRTSEKHINPNYAYGKEPIFNIFTKWKHEGYDAPSDECDDEDDE